MELSNVEVTLVDSLLPTAAGYKAPLPLLVASGFVPQTLTIGFPEVRDVVDKRPIADGTYDYTAYYGSGSVQLVVAIASELTPGLDDEDLLDMLKAWMPPGRRTYLHYRFSPTKPLRRILCRTTAASRPYNFVRNNFGMVSLGWRSVDGVSEAVDEITFDLSPGGTGELGRAYDLTFDRTYPASTPLGTAVRNILGTDDALPFVRIFGPCTQPRIENITTGKKLEFLSTFSLLAGEFLDIDFKEGTVLLDGNPANSRYDKVDFSVSEWWTLIPGDNLLRYYPLAFTFPSLASFFYRPKFI